MATLKKPTQDELKAGVQGIVEQYKGAKFGAPVPTINLPAAYGPDVPEDFYNNPEPAPDYGPPEGWDYRTSQKGWQGEDLPYGAVSWDNFGRPYYGPGVKGWLNKFFSKMNAPFIDDPDQGVWATKQQDLIIEETGEKIGTMPGPNFAKIWENLKSGEGTTPVAYAARAVEAIVGSGLDAISQPAKETERVMGAIGEVGEIGGGYNAGDIRNAPEWIQNLVGGVPPEQLGTADTRDLRDVIGVPDADWNEIKKSWDRGYNAGKILWTGVIDPMKREEFIKRYDAGENPDLLAIELENPLAEMVGQMVFDPLNFVGIPIKALRDAKRVRNVKAEFIDLPDDLNDALRFMDASGDARSAESMDNILNATQKAFDDTRSGLDKFAKTTGSLYTADAKRWQVGRRTGEVASWIASHSQGATDIERAENTLQMYRALADMASGDKAKIAAAFKTISHFDAPRPLLSRAGRELGIVLNDMLSDKKFLEQLVEAVGRGKVAKKVDDVNALDNMLKFAEQKLGKTIDDMFPSVDDLLKREAELKKAGKAITDPVPNWIRAVNNVNNKLQKVVGPINRRLSWIYMGKNPGYSFRNFMQNRSTAVIDYGFGAFKHKPYTWSEKTNKYLKGTRPRGASGFSQSASFEQTIKPLTYDGEDLGKEALDAIKRADFAAASNVEEKATSVSVVGYTVEKVMNDLLRFGKGLPFMDDAVAKGLSGDVANWFMERLRANFFDVDVTYAELLEKIKTGSVEVFRSGDWISPAQWEQLRAYELADPMHDILANAKTKQEAQERLAELLAEKRTIAGGVVDEVAEVGVETEIAQSYVNFADELNETTVRSANYYITANQNANLAYREALDELIELSPTNQELKLARRQIQEAGSEVYRQAQERYQTTRAYVERVGRKDFKLEDAWNALGDGTPMPFHTPQEFKQWMWDQYCFPFVRNIWDEYRKASAATIEKLARDIGQGEAGKIVNARKLNAEADLWMKTSRYDQYRLQLDDAINAGDNEAMVRVIANKYGIPSVSERGAPLDRRILDTINKYSDTKYDSLSDIKDQRIVEDAFAKRIADKATEAVPGSEALAAIEPELVDPVMPLATPKPPYSPGAFPTKARTTAEGMQGLEKLIKQVSDGFERNWGKTQEVIGNPELNKALSDWRKVASRQTAEARLIAANVANAARDFTVLAYPNKTYLDLAAAYIFPYQFWYSRSYTHWMERIATDPQVIAAYARYKDTLSKIHAGAPEWYKYNLNTNDLPGVDVKNPLFFNLEATLWPLNGLTGIDFTDKYKRVNWWTKTLDDLNKFGPSTWTPLSIATAVALQIQGEEDAASRWGGRLIPQTATVKSLLNLMNVNIQTRAGINEFDPNVHLFSGGMDPYERNRVGRALGTLVEEGVIDRETAIEAARTQSGDAWRMATIRAIHDRAGGQLSSFFLGVGFKARNVTDVQIDQFYSEMYRLWNMSDTMSPEEFRRQNDAIKDKYPFADSVLLAKKAGPEKDTAYAYNVLSRVPPGQSDDVFRALGIDKLRTRFYDDKGDMAAWSESDRQSFMNAVIDLGALLKLPDTATRQEWTEASIANNKMYDDMEKQFGAAGMALYERWLALSEDIDAKRDLQNANPVLDQLLDYKDSMIVSNPLLRQYYASIEAVERYYGSFMSAKLEQQFGADIYDIQDAYYDLMTTKDQKAYKRQYPQLEQFWKAKAEYKKTVAEMVARTGKALKEGMPALLRTDETNSVGQERILDELNQPRVPEYYQYSYADWMQNFPPEMQRLLEDYVYGEKELPYIAEKELEYFAGRLNEEPEIILELIEQSAR